jgi:hypothetical protein
MGNRERSRAAANIAEDETGAGTGCGGKHGHHAVQAEQEISDHRHFQQQQGQCGLQQQGECHKAPME